MQPQTIAKGVRVSHAHYGFGIIRSLDDTTEPPTAWVAFDKDCADRRVKQADCQRAPREQLAATA